MDEKPNVVNVTDQILDLLLDALAERQRARAAANGRLDTADSWLAEWQSKAETAQLEAEEVVVTQPQSGTVPQPVAITELLDEVANLIVGDSVEDVEPGEYEDYDEEPLPEPLPMIGLGRMLGRLALVVAVLLVIVNIPFNRFGTSLARAMPDEAALIIRDGLVLKGSDERIYVLENNQLRWISSLDAFEHFGYRWEQVQEVEDSLLAEFQQGRPIHLLLKCPGSPHVYALEDGRKRWIKDIPTFEAEGYVWEDVLITTSCGEINRLPLGTPIPADAGTPP